MSIGNAEWTVIGGRIRAARRAAGMSIQDLAGSVSVSASHVSQVERGLGSFSAAVLYAVASRLDLSLDSLFGDPVADSAADDAERPVPAASPAEPLSTLVLRADERPSIKLHGGPRWQRLTRHSEQGVELLEVTYGPGDASSEGETFVRHSGREHGIVVEGELTVQVGFETIVLHAGDTVSFDSTTPHRFWNATDGAVRAIWFVRDPVLPDAEAPDPSRGSDAHFPG